MAYKDLQNLFYTNKEEYTHERDTRPKMDNAVSVDFMIGSSAAFFVECPEVGKTVYSILRLDKEVALLVKKLPPIASQQYSRKCLIDEIVLSNRIEGVHSSRREIGEILSRLEGQSSKRGKSQRFHGLVNKYLRLMSRERISLRTCQDIRDIYNDLVLDEVVRENPAHAPDGAFFRKEQTEVLDQYGKVIHAGVYPEQRIIDSMEKALAFLHNEKVDQLYRICLFHYMFEYIHPFYDGNGRLGRFILSYCIADALEPLLSYRLSETVLENKRAYYKAFDTCNDPRCAGDLTPFLIMMLGMIEKSATDLRSSLSQKLSTWGRFGDIADEVFSNDGDSVSKLANVLIQASLFSERGISTHELLEITQVSRATLTKYLKTVGEKRLLIVSSFSREKYYQLDLDALMEWKNTQTQ